MPDFKDYFSKFAQTYARGRLTYPPELFAMLASLTHEHELAWDCGTGNGQAALGLTAYYQKVIATDPSEQQIANCIQHPQITYKVEMAEEPSLSTHSADLLTISAALHWFNFEKFYAQAQRVLKKGGIIAAWTYFFPTISPEIDAIFKDFDENVLGPYWKPETKYIRENYQTLPFPFEELIIPPFFIEREWDLESFTEHAHTWSAVQFYKQTKNEDAVELLLNHLLPVWGDPKEKKKIRWKLSLRVGKNT